ncbi:probable platelet-activating factor acetylhydrolase IB subunit beta at C-terminar half [Coccomyxa sp. Obi]|nr:probable platelet-activating factor acetylhydrolase IB subunit beta at C-terminar half [Coccomyxa sp. Obi]
MWRRWLWLFVLLLLHLAQSDARIQPLQHRRAKGLAASRGQNNGAVTASVGASGVQGLRKNSGLKARRRRAHNTVGVKIPQIPQERRRRRRAGEKLALQAGEESGDAPPVAKGTKKKKKKAGGKKKMSKEEAIAAAQEAQAAAAAALLKGISHEEAAKAAEALLNEKGASELTKGVLGAEDVEKAEGRPAPFKKKDEGSKDAAATEAGAAAADGAAAPPKKKKKKKKAAAAAASGADAEKVEEASKDNAAAAADGSEAEAESKASAEAKPAAEATNLPKPVTKKKKKKKIKKKAATGEVSDRSLRVLDSGAPMLTQQGGAIVDVLDKEVDDEYYEDYEVEDEEIEDDAEEEEFELEMTGVAENERAADAALSEAGPRQEAPPVTTPAAPNGAHLPERSAHNTVKQESSGRAGESPQNAGLVSAAAAQPSAQLAAVAPAAAGEAASGAAAGAPGVAAGASGAVAGTPAQAAAKPARPWFPLPEKREISTEVLSSLINASAAAVKRDAAAFTPKLHKHDAAAEDSAPHHHHGETLAEREGKHAKREEGKEEGSSEPVHQLDAPAAEVEPPALPEVKQLPPWFKDTPDNKDVVKVGSGQRHKSRQKALGAEEKWLRAHQRHLAEVREEHDVIFYGDDLIEAWRGTFVGQKYGPFNDIPAVWDQFFGTKGYKALAAGIAGDGVEHLLWRLKNGELPPIVPPKAIIIACGTNSKGLSGECALPAAEEAAAAMLELLEFVREALPATRIVVLVPLPKGDYWPNRCTPAFDLFNANLQAIAGEHPGHVHVKDYGAAFLTSRAANVWQSNSTAAVRQEINEMFMPDALHPSAAGMRLIAGKLEPLVSRLVSEAGAAGAQSA